MKMIMDTIETQVKRNRAQRENMNIIRMLAVTQSQRKGGSKIGNSPRLLRPSSSLMIWRQRLLKRKIIPSNPGVQPKR
jgi:hypothetical protein